MAYEARADVPNQWSSSPNWWVSRRQQKQKQDEVTIPETSPTEPYRKPPKSGGGKNGARRFYAS